MSEKSNVLKEKVKHKGFFSFEELYKFCYEWLKNENYHLSENEYKEKITPIGKEIRIKWEAKKKISDYFRNIIELEWETIGLTEAEVEIEGKKQKTNKGEVTLKFSADLEKDYEEKWEVNPFYKFFRGIYDKYIIRSTIDEYEDRLIDKTNEFIREVKAFLVLEGK